MISLGFCLLMTIDDKASPSRTTKTKVIFGFWFRPKMLPPTSTNFSPFLSAFSLWPPPKTNCKCRFGHDTTDSNGAPTKSEVAIIVTAKSAAGETIARCLTSSTLTLVL